VAVVAKRSGRSAEKAEVNRQVKMAVKRFDRPELGEETWDFLCECGADQCKEWVTLTLRQYESLLQAEEPILAPGHGLTRGQRARRKARKLSDDAKALRAQSDVQHKRTGRNLGENA
jgi:hypothetical protein